MKHLIRIIVTILVVGALGVGAYFIWFKPDKDLSTFLALNDLSEFKQQINLDNNMQDLYLATGHGTVTVKKVVTITNEDADTVTESTENFDFAIPFDTDFLPNYGLSENPYEVIINKVNYEDILSIRAILFQSKTDYINADLINLNESLLLEKNDNNIKYSYYSYSVMEQYLNQVYSHYLAYTQVAQGVSSSAQKAIKKTLNEYRDALEALNQSILSTLNYQIVYNYKIDSIIDQKEFTITNDNVTTKIYVPNYVGDDNAAHLELYNRYHRVLKNYRYSLNLYVDLINELKDFVNKFVYNGNVINNVKTAEYDIFLMSAKNAVGGNYDTIADKKQANIWLTENKLFMTALNNASIYESQLLEDYNKIVNNYYQGLQSVMAFLPDEKIAFVNNPYTQPSIKTDYVQSLINILKVYGY